MNTIIIHRSIPRPYTSRDKYEAVDVVFIKPTPWWVGEGESSQKLETIPEEVVDAVAGVDGDTIDVEDDVTVVDPDEDSGKILLGEIDVDEQFGWAERLALEEDLEQDDDEEDWVIDTYASGWCSIVHEEEKDLSIYSQDSFVEEGDNRSEHSQDNFVECDPEESQLPTRLTGEILARVVKFMTKSAHMARGRRTRRAL